MRTVHLEHRPVTQLDVAEVADHGLGDLDEVRRLDHGLGLLGFWWVVSGLRGGYTSFGRR